MAQSDASREYMIEGQLVPGHIIDERILSAMRAVPRELCVPAAIKGAAYIDEDIEIAEGRYLMEPLTFARLLEMADIQPTDNVLIIGGGMGYSAAVVGHIARRVIAVEEQGELAEKARQLLNRLHLANVEVVTGALSLGYPVAKPYNIIIIEGAVRQVPETLKQQLAEHGRLVTVENIATRPGYRGGLGKMLLVWREGNQFYERYGEDAGIPVLPGFEEKSQFVF